MHRGGGVEEELLAISPPPEFQDIPAPPPPVFRDLSPFPRSQGEGSSLVAGNKKSSDSHPQPLRDFADRISFDILNEAMVIATEKVLSYHHGGCNHNAVVAPTDQSFSAAEFPFSSDSSDTDEENPVSTTTSWEYLSKASSWSDLRCHRSASPPQHSRLHTSPRHQNHRTSRNKKPDSINSICLFTNSGSNHGPVSFHNEKPSSTHQQPLVATRSASFHMDTIFPLVPSINKNNKDLSAEETIKGPVIKSRNRSADDTSTTCYKVPFQCDIYSLPIDNILPHSEDHQKSTIAPKRSRCKGPSQSFHITLGQDATNVSVARNDEYQAHGIGSSGSTHDQQSYTNRHPTKTNFGKPEISLDSACNVHVNLQSLLTSGETNNNFDNSQQFEVGNSTRNFRPPRSRSVEMSKSENSIICRQNNSSQNSNFSIENTPSLLAEQHCPEKVEKRTLGHSILNLFKRNKPRNRREPLQAVSYSTDEHSSENRDSTTATKNYRALPLPPESNEIPISEDVVDKPPPEARDFAASIEKVKDCGWYWGPLSSEAAEDLLRGEPDGSFIVRDSSDAHYIFSLTFKLNGLVRHVRIEHDQGNFSFGPLTRFKASTIVDFVEKAVAHSRSGRYLFFLHRRPVLGPMRVQLLHPYSRFRHPRSLQHMCRFVILKYVRRDLIQMLPLPKPLQDYLNTPHYYFEQHEQKKTAV